jgi:hypothetical protein
VKSTNYEVPFSQFSFFTLSLSSEYSPLHFLLKYPQTTFFNYGARPSFTPMFRVQTLVLIVFHLNTVSYSKCKEVTWLGSSFVRIWVLLEVQIQSTTEHGTCEHFQCFSECVRWLYNYWNPSEIYVFRTYYLKLLTLLQTVSENK